MRRGWCPSVAEPMPTGDGLLARVAPPMATLTQDAARALADAARRYGNGRLGVTSRARIQVRGLGEASAPPFARAMRDAGLGEDDRLVVSPLAGDDPGVASDIHDVARAAAARIGSVHPKYMMVVDGGGVLPLDGVRGDARLGFVDGAWRDVAASDRAAPVSVGLIPYGAGKRAAFGVAPVFGGFDADALDALATISARHGDGSLRLTPWRTLLIAGLLRAEAVLLARDCAAAGFVVDPADPRLAVTACVGGPACASAQVATDAAALILARAGVRAHVSGCAKGCAHPNAAPLTLVGRDGRFDVVLDGRASDAPSRHGVTAAEAVA